MVSNVSTAQEVSALVTASTNSASTSFIIRTRSLHSVLDELLDAVRNDKSYTPSSWKLAEIAELSQQLTIISAQYAQVKSLQEIIHDAACS